MAGSVLRHIFVLAVLCPAVLACGGFFCFRQQPVDQAGEHILFMAHDDNTVESHIQIQYSGPSEEFSWVLPLPAVPELALSSQTMFTDLITMTSPRLQVDTDDAYRQGSCQCLFCPPQPMPAGAPGAADSESGGVSVLAEGEVGPFTFVVVFDTNMEGTPMVDWLNENNFDQPDETAPLIKRYASMGMVFLGLKLKKGKSAGDLQPIMVRFATTEPMPAVPLALTRVAAVKDMPIRVFVLGKARAFPVNFFDVAIPEKNLPWPWVDLTYMEELTKAVDEANGHGFVTEYAGSPGDVGQRLAGAAKSFDEATFAALDTPSAFLRELMSLRVRNDPLVTQMIQAYIPMPDGVDLSDNCQNSWNYYSFRQVDECTKEALGSSWTFDSKTFAKDLATRVIEPIATAGELLSRDLVLTRLTTTVSPEEMTKDPVFDYNANLPNVSSTHTVKVKTISCTDTAESYTLAYQDGTSANLEFTKDKWTCTQTTQKQRLVSKVQAVYANAQPVAVAAGSVDSVETLLDKVAMPTCTGAPLACVVDGKNVSMPLRGPKCRAQCPGDIASVKCRNCSPPDTGNGDGTNAAAKVHAGYMYPVAVAILVAALAVLA